MRYAVIFNQDGSVHSVCQGLELVVLAQSVPPGGRLIFVDEDTYYRYMNQIKVRV